MREFSMPLSVEVPRVGNLTDDVVRNAQDAPDAPVLFRRTVDGWAEVTAEEFLGEVADLAKGLIAAGVEPGDRVALMSRTRDEWMLFDYAIWFAGAVTVPIYETSSPEQVRWILQDSRAVALVVENQDHRVRTAHVRSELDSLRHVWSIDDRAEAALRGLGSDVTEAQLEQRRGSATPLDLATVVYTSGTTGRPKGCMLTHGNFMFELRVALDELDALFGDEDARGLVCVPMAHGVARVMQVGCVKARVPLAHSVGDSTLTQDLAEIRPTFVLADPHVLDKIVGAAAHDLATGKARMLARASVTAIAWSRGLERGRGRATMPVRAQHLAMDRLVFARLRVALGGRCRYVISGGAPMGERLGHFLRGIGVTVLEGYGLTETTAAVAVNVPDAQKIGTVGRPLPGCSIRVADDGELLVRGEQVFVGYWEDEPATRAVLERDGWFHTGDLGEVDHEGFVRITGRKREIMVTAGGKSVSPAMLEDRLRTHPMVDQCLVVGDGRPFIAALVTLDHHYLGQWAIEQGKPNSLSDLIDDPDLRARVQEAVDEANKAVSRAESIRKFRILPSEWTEEGGQLTPSLKLRRTVVLHESEDEVASLYT